MGGIGTWRILTGSVITSLAKCDKRSACSNTEAHQGRRCVLSINGARARTHTLTKLTVRRERIDGHAHSGTLDSGGGDTVVATPQRRVGDGGVTRADPAAAVQLTWPRVARATACWCLLWWGEGQSAAVDAYGARTAARRQWPRCSVRDAMARRRLSGRDAQIY